MQDARYTMQDRSGLTIVHHESCVMDQGLTMDFTEDQIMRYSRHILLPEVGGEGQEKILQAKVVLVGAGGLGSPAALYLAAAGIGTIGLIDSDVVDLTNLQRQVTFSTSDVGRPKVESARETLLLYNPDINVVTHAEPLTSDNALEIIGRIANRLAEPVDVQALVKVRPDLDEPWVIVEQVIADIDADLFTGYL